MTDKLFYGKGLPYLQLNELPGKLIVREGADCSDVYPISMLKDGWKLRAC